MNGGVIVEIGGNRGEGSSAFLKDFAKRHNMEMHTIDIAPIVFADMDLYNGIQTHTMDGAEFLKTFDKKIKFAYLDNYYWLFSFNLDALKSIYNINPKTNNDESRKAHLTQAIEVDKLADKPCFIMFDDTWKMPDGLWDGKGGTAIPYLLKKGWKILNDPPANGEDVDAYVFLKKE